MDSIKYAKRIQEAILPPTKLVREYLTESYIIYKPKDIVAGDFYWFDVIENEVFFAVADCTGHGVPGAMVSVVCANAIKRTVNELKIHDPGKILDRVRELVIETFEKSEEEVKDGMDISFCKWNMKTNELSYSGAHNPLYLITTNNNLSADKELIDENFRLLEFKGDKQPIGNYGYEKPFNQIDLQLQKGDIIFLSSDGFADQFGGPKGKKFMYKPFKTFLLSLRNKSMDQQKVELNKKFESWKGANEQVDDVCVMGIRI